MNGKHSIHDVALFTKYRYPHAKIATQINQSTGKPTASTHELNKVAGEKILICP